MIFETLISTLTLYLYIYEIYGFKDFLIRFEPVVKNGHFKEILQVNKISSN